MTSTRRGAAAEPARERSIQVWRIHSPGDVRGLERMLPDDELARARQQGRTSPDTYIAARALLRVQLGAVLGLAAREVVLERSCALCGATSHGKPRVTRTGQRRLDFSISYGGAYALVALAAQGRVGVDVEPITTSPAVSRWCYDEGEQRQLADLDEATRCVEITRAWVRKEAVAKACGLGLSLPLSRVATTGDLSRWRLPSPATQIRDIPMPEGLAAAVAYDDSQARLEVSSWDPCSCRLAEVRR
jgi:4'-phosphopantetheinyl transferase